MHFKVLMIIVVCNISSCFYIIWASSGHNAHMDDQTELALPYVQTMHPPISSFTAFLL